MPLFGGVNKKERRKRREGNALLKAVKWMERKGDEVREGNQSGSGELTRKRRRKRKHRLAIFLNHFCNFYLDS